MLGKLDLALGEPISEEETSSNEQVKSVPWLDALVSEEELSFFEIIL